MRIQLLALVALASVLALAGCTKTPAGDAVTPAQATPTRYDPPPGYTPDPTPPSPTPTTPPTQPTQPPSSPTPPTPPANATPTPPASTPPDFTVAKTGWVVPNSQTDPNATIRLIVPLEFGARNLTLRVSDALVVPTGSARGSPFSVAITDPQGKTVATAGTSLEPTSAQPPPVPSNANPENETYEINSSAWHAGEYTVVLTITPAIAGDSSNAGERYALLVYVHY